LFLIGAAARFGGYLCVFAIVGMVVFRLLARARLPAEPAPAGGAVASWRAALERRAARGGLLACSALVVFDLVRLWEQIKGFSGADPATLELAGVILGGTLWGSGWKLQVAAAGAAGLCFGAAARRWPAAWPLAGGLALLVAVSRPLTGHALEQGSWLSLPAILQAIHVLAGAVWMGTLFAVLAIGWRGARSLPAPRRTAAIAALVAGFSPVALSAVTALFMAGAATSFLYLDSLGALFATGYGLVLLAKIGGFALVAAAGYFNWQKVRPVLEAAARLGGAAGETGAVAGGAGADRGAQAGEKDVVAGGADADRRAQAGGENVAAGGEAADRRAQAGEKDVVAGGEDADRRAQAGEALLLRAASLELAIAVAVLALTAVLVALPMPAG